MMPLLPEMAPMTSHWGVYFAVRDIEAAFQKATALGGHPFIPVTPIPGVGRFSVVADPTGAMIAHFSA